MSEPTQQRKLTTEERKRREEYATRKAMRHIARAQNALRAQLDLERRERIDAKNNRVPLKEVVKAQNDVSLINLHNRTQEAIKNVFVGPPSEAAVVTKRTETAPMKFDVLPTKSTPIIPTVPILTGLTGYISITRDFSGSYGAGLWIRIENGLITTLLDQLGESLPDWGDLLFEIHYLASAGVSVTVAW